MHKFLKKFNLFQPAKDEDILSFENASGKKLPGDYIELLKITNGGEGFIGDNYLILWGIEELISQNESYEVELNAPGLLIFGTDGGGEAFGFDTRKAKWSVAQIPFVGMFWEEALPKANSFKGFIECLHAS
jgi:hypothetical protein